MQLLGHKGLQRVRLCTCEAHCFRTTLLSLSDVMHVEQAGPRQAFCWHRFPVPTLAQLNLQDRKKAEEWSSLADAGAGEEYVPEEDPLFLDDINRLCNSGLKKMLQVGHLSELLSTLLTSTKTLLWGCFHGERCERYGSETKGGGRVVLWCCVIG